MGEWKTTTIGEIAEVYDGPHATPPKTQSGPWFLSISSLDNGRLNLAESAHISEADFERWTRRVTPREGDVLFSYETRLGEAALMPAGLRACLGRRMGLLRPKPDRVDSRFLLYAYLGPEFQEVIRQRAVHGATVDRIPLTELPNWPISIPSLREQRAIAAVLGALDDEIAVNEWIARTSLDLADAHFELVTRDLACGSETFGSVAEVFGGGTPRTSEPAYWDGPISWATPSDVTALHVPYLFTTARKITEKGLAECASQLYPPGSIFMTSRATIGAFAVPQVPTAVGQGFIVVIPRQPEMRWWLFHEMRSRVDEMRSLANGSTLLGLSREDFKAMRVRLAEPDVIARFSAQVDPLHKQAAKCVEESHTLAQLRDTLLPKLMSGELRVRDAEKASELTGSLEAGTHRSAA